MKKQKRKGKRNAKDIDVQVRHVSKGSVIDDLGLSEEKKTALKIKIALHQTMMRFIDEEGFTARQVEKILDEPQPKVSVFLNGKIGHISIEKLLRYAEKLGFLAVGVELRVNRSRRAEIREAA